MVGKKKYNKGLDAYNRRDPVHKIASRHLMVRDSYWFYTEGWMARQGPFKTKKEARAASKEYAKKRFCG